LIKILFSFAKTISTKMLTKIYQLLCTFSVEYLSALAFKPQNKSCGTFCRIGDANVSNLILIIRPTEFCNNVAHLCLTQ